MNPRILDHSITMPEASIPVDESIIVVGDSLKLIDYLPFSFANLIFIDPPYGDVVLRQKFHKTPKPVKLIERVILAHTKPGDIVFDCFAGAMTTWEACRRTGRRFVGIELSMDHVIKGIEFFGKQNNGQLELI